MLNPVAEPADVPLRPEDLTSTWLTQRLREAGAITGDTNVAAFEATPVGVGHGFAGRLVRLTLHYAAPAAGAPATLIAKFGSDQAPMLAVMTLVGAFEREVNFYRELAASAGIGVPRCYFAYCAPGSPRFCLLLEDLAPARTADRELGMSLGQAELVMTELARFHARWWNRTDEVPWLALSTDLARLVRDRYVAALPGFTAGYGAMFPALARAARLIRTLLAGDEFIKQLQKPPLTLAHNDLHIDNVFLPTEAGGRFALIDWQSVSAVRQGVADVARVLTTGLSPDLRRKHGNALLARYHAELVRNGVRGYPLLLLKYRYRQELAAMVIVMVLALETLDFEQAEARAAVTVIGARCEAALIDASFVAILFPLVALVQLQRWFLSWFK